MNRADLVENIASTAIAGLLVVALLAGLRRLCDLLGVAYSPVLIEIGVAYALILVFFSLLSITAVLTAMP